MSKALGLPVAAFAFSLSLAACAPGSTLAEQGSADLGSAVQQVLAAVPMPAAQADTAQQATLGTLAFVPKVARLPTRWTAQVSQSNPLPDYPRPQLTRPEWQSLNGQWQFDNASAGQAPPVGRTLPETVLVPYPIESALSGIARHQDRMWYRRTFSVPQNWNGQNVLLNFGAVDYQATVYVNGQQVGSHSGGYDGFSFDITSKLRSGDNELIVNVFDPTNSGSQPRGKQLVGANGGIEYTPSSGIWQTVWLEPVAAPHIARLDLTPDLASGELRVKVLGEGTGTQTVQVTAFDGTTEVGSISGAVGSELRLPIANAKLWSPDSPFLYNLTATLNSGNAVVDTVGSYFGMRSIEKKVVNGVQRPLLNGKFVFQLGTLDQGYWPDGLYTAPTDDALKFDLQKHKDLGFNMVRKHVKVEPQRWFYWADKLGLMVWQDMPRMNNNPNSAARSQFELELREMVDEHRSSPSVVTWVPFNEGWGQYDQARIADLVKGLDPSRLVDNMSGINCCGAVDGGNGDLADWHVYVGPGTPPSSNNRISVLGEFGGLGLQVAGHTWSTGNFFSYEQMADSNALNTRYLGLITSLKNQMINRGLSASVYTEITDVEHEINGLLTYDREITKVDTARLKAAHVALIAASNDPSTVVNVTLPLDQYRSFQATNSGLTNRSARHRNSLGYTEVVDARSSATLRADATFKIVRGLGDPNCYSLQARNIPNSYLRHASSRIRLDNNDNGSLFKNDATWCARTGNAGTGNSGAGVSLESLNYPGRYLRHINAELWLAGLGGPLQSDNGGNFDQDTTWNVIAPWAP